MKMYLQRALVDLIFMYRSWSLDIRTTYWWGCTYSSWMSTSSAKSEGKSSRNMIIWFNEWLMSTQKTVKSCVWWSIYIVVPVLHPCGIRIYLAWKSTRMHPSYWRVPFTSKESPCQGGQTGGLAFYVITVTIFLHHY